MTLNVDLWQVFTFIVGLGITLLGGALAGGRMLLAQTRSHLAERFEALDLARTTSAQAFREQLQRHMDDEEKALSRLPMLEREFLEFKAELPLHYVRREDYVRGQSIIEAKLDALYSELKLVQLKGTRND